jgi:hypothetical protein
MRARPSVLTGAQRSLLDRDLAPLGRNLPFYKDRSPKAFSTWLAQPRRSPSACRQSSAASDIPDVLQAARENLTNLPPEYTEQAIRYFKARRVLRRHRARVRPGSGQCAGKQFHESNMRVPKN